MSAMQPLLIEVGTDELPVAALPGLAQALFDGVVDGLARYLGTIAPSELQVPGGCAAVVRLFPVLRSVDDFPGKQRGMFTIPSRIHTSARNTGVQFNARAYVTGAEAALDIVLSSLYQRNQLVPFRFHPVDHLDRSPMHLR